MNYQQLDQIADAYVPTLVIITIIWYVRRAFVEDTKSVMYAVGATFAGTIFIYLIMYVDSRLKVYSSIDLDYSTHTALALVFITALALIGRKAFLAASTSMILYCALMLYQEYHTLLDILLTTLNTLPFLIWFHVKARQFKSTN